MISTTGKFNQLAQGSVRPLAWDLAISFTKDRSETMDWFKLGVSVLDGDDILSMSEEQPIQVWDYYKYESYKDRLISMDITRSVEFPNNVQSAILDFTLDNHDGLFTYDNAGGASPIAEYILPNRPVRSYLGFKGAGVVPSFVGMTQQLPTYQGVNDNVMSWTAMDFLSEIGEQYLNETIIMKDATTDQVLEVIFQQFGIDPSMYDLATGLNTIPFVYFTKGKDAGNAMRELLEAEGGSLWLDEKGIIRFTTMTSDLGKTPVMTFDEGNIISFEPSRTSNIINRVKIKSDIRAVQSSQPIFSADNEKGFESTDDAYRIPASGNLTVWLNFDDPIWTADVSPVLNGSTSGSHFTAQDLSGTALASGITASGELFADSAKLTFTNATANPASISFLQIWGEPSKVVDTIDYDAYDQDSIDKYGNLPLEISDNNFFGSYNNVDKFATRTLEKRAEYSPTLNMQVKGNPALELGDIVHVVYKNEGDYKIIGMKHSLTNTGLATTLTVERYEVVTQFILDQSVLDGGDVLG